MQQSATATFKEVEGVRNSEERVFEKSVARRLLGGGGGVRKRGLLANKHDRIVIAVRAVLDGGLWKPWSWSSSERATPAQGS